MIDVVLFHHAQGLTPGVIAFADRLRAAGHRVELPDLYGGLTFDDLDAGVAHAEGIGMSNVVVRGEKAVAGDPAVVYAGFSLGSLPAQVLAQTRPAALGCVLFHGGQPAGAVGPGWPPAVPLQLHYAQDDPWVPADEVGALEEDAEAEVFRYPGSAHLFTDASLPSYDEALTGLVVERTLAFLSLRGGGGR